jgi:hypothetical protein
MNRPQGETLIVVQAHRERFFGISASVIAEGFIASTDGATVDAPAGSLWDYT